MKTFIYLIVLCYSIHRITYVFVFLDMIKRRCVGSTKVGQWLVKGRT